MYTVSCYFLSSVFEGFSNLKVWIYLKCIIYAIFLWQFFSSPVLGPPHIDCRLICPFFLCCPSLHHTISIYKTPTLWFSPQLFLFYSFFNYGLSNETLPPISILFSFSPFLKMVSLNKLVRIIIRNTYILTEMLPPLSDTQSWNTFVFLGCG